VHACDPVSGLYLPAAHCEHASPSGPVHPALQKHFVRAPAPASELEPVGHVRQVEAAVAAREGE